MLMNQGEVVESFVDIEAAIKINDILQAILLKIEKTENLPDAGQSLICIDWFTVKSFNVSLRR